MNFSYKYQKEKKFFAYCESKINYHTLKRRKAKYNYQPLSTRKKSQHSLTEAHHW